MIGMEFQLERWPAALTYLEESYDNKSFQHSQSATAEKVGCVNRNWHKALNDSYIWEELCGENANEIIQ